MRGLSWRTKTGVQGAPFGLLTSGFLSLGTWTWTEKWLRTLDQILVNQNLDMVDFLLPAVNPTCTEVIFPLRPMQYGEALFWARRFLGLPWKTSPLLVDQSLLSYTVHGLKSTFLSWSSQLQVQKDLRRLQGHHREDSAQLYSRDDVNGALSLQTQVVSAVKSQ